MSKIKLYISKQEDTVSEDLLYADETKLVSWFEDTECEVETEDCELCLLEPLQTQKAIECLKEVREELSYRVIPYDKLYESEEYTRYDEGCLDSYHFAIRRIDNKIKELEGDGE